MPGHDQLMVVNLKKDTILFTHHDRGIKNSTIEEIFSLSPVRVSLLDIILK